MAKAKFAICSDVHIGRMSWQNELFEKKFVKFCEDRIQKDGCSAIIVAGDFLDRSTISIKNINHCLSIFNRFPHVTFYLIPGNHDNIEILKIFGILDNVIVVYEPEILSSYGVLLLPWGKYSCNAGDYKYVVTHGGFGEEGGDLSKINQSRIDKLISGHIHKVFENDKYISLGSLNSCKPGDEGVYGIIDENGFSYHEYDSDYDVLYVEKQYSSIDLSDLTKIENPDRTFISVIYTGDDILSDEILDYINTNFLNYSFNQVQSTDTLISEYELGINGFRNFFSNNEIFDKYYQDFEKGEKI